MNINRFIQDVLTIIFYKPVVNTRDVEYLRRTAELIIDLIILMDILVLLYIICFRKNIYEHWVLYQGSYPIINYTLVSLGIDTIFMYLLISILIFYLYKYATEYHLVFVTILIVNIASMLFIILDFLIKETLSLATKLIMLCLILYLCMCITIVRFKMSIMLHRYLLTSLYIGYLIGKYSKVVLKDTFTYQVSK